MDRVKAGSASKGEVCLAETQLSGRGRCERLWLSPPTGNLYLSLLWYFSTGSQLLSSLSLAAGVAVLRTLQEQGVTSAGLKWPNDIVLWDYRKLGGILVELVSRGDIIGAIIGIGLNVNMPISYRQQLNQPCADLSEVMNNRWISRSQLAGRLIHHLLLIMRRFEKQGLKDDILNDWRKWDICYQREVYLHSDDQIISGTAYGIDNNGRLLLWRNDGISCYSYGEVSLRPVK